MNIRTYRAQFEEELFEHVLPFWEKYSPDRSNGGYFNALDRDGSRYDDSKFVWLQARQVWLFSTLWLNVEEKDTWKDIAQLGVHFLKEHALSSDGRAFFSLTKEGEPLWMQRKIFSECFIIMAFAQFSRVTNDSDLMGIAKTLFDTVLKWSTDLTQIGRPAYSGAVESQTLAVPMILLNVIEELTQDGWREYQDTALDCIRRMLMHVDDDRRIVLENVGNDGKFLDTIDGRLLNPGHAIEAGWFLQNWAKKLDRPDLSTTASNMIRWSLEKGWDAEHGGIFYFLDAKGYSPVQLEWDMKLWWPHNEAMFACLQNYSITGSAEDWSAFEQVSQYAFSHFPDHEHGEWFGYLNRRGEVTHRFKGGPYKGCFHVPRSLLLCWRLLKQLEESMPPPVQQLQQP